MSASSARKLSEKPFCTQARMPLTFQLIIRFIFKIPSSFLQTLLIFVWYHILKYNASGAAQFRDFSFLVDRTAVFRYNKLL
jgi:hypothetical protein